MMGRRVSVYRFFVRGSTLNCPDCGGETIVSGGSILGSINKKVVPKDVINHIYADCFEEEWVGDLCSECSCPEKQIVLWVEVDTGYLKGPFCRVCFYEFVEQTYGGMRDATDDAAVYFMRVNDRTQEEVYAIAAAIVQRGEEQVSRVDPIDDLDLF